MKVPTISDMIKDSVAKEDLSQENEEQEKGAETINIGKFLVTASLFEKFRVKPFHNSRTDGYTYPHLKMPCSDKVCIANKTTVFKLSKETSIYITDNLVGALKGKHVYHHMCDFQCTGCGRSRRSFAFLATSLDGGDWEVFKYGQLPELNIPNHDRTLDILHSEEEKDYYMKGLKCESMGLGIAAFSYYRRVIESQRDLIYDKIIEIAKEVDPQDPVIQDLEEAKNERQFKKSIGKIKASLPASLMFRSNQNPLVLLYNGVSQGMHAETDEDCLMIAHAVREVLSELAERIHRALMKNDSLHKSVGILSSATAKSRKKKSKTIEPKVEPVETENIEGDKEG